MYLYLIFIFDSGTYTYIKYLLFLYILFEQTYTIMIIYYNTIDMLLK